MPAIEVFKTNVLEDKEAKYLLSQLSTQFPYHRINFDLQDCDKILRVEGKQVFPEKIIALVNTYGYQCQVLD